MSIENLKTFDPFAEADEDTGETKQSQNYIHIRIQQRNGRKTLTTVQGLPKKFDQKKILKVIKKKFGKWSTPQPTLATNVTLTSI
jgi:translation initiation factor 1